MSAYTRVSDERLAELISKHQEHHDYTVKILPFPVEWERKVIQESANWLSALRELRERRELMSGVVTYLDRTDCYAGLRVCSTCDCGLDSLLSRIRALVEEG